MNASGKRLFLLFLFVAVLHWTLQFVPIPGYEKAQNEKPLEPITIEQFLKDEKRQIVETSKALKQDDTGEKARFHYSDR